MSELLQAAGAAPTDGPGPDPGEPHVFHHELHFVTLIAVPLMP